MVVEQSYVKFSFKNTPNLQKVHEISVFHGWFEDKIAWIATFKGHKILHDFRLHCVQLIASQLYRNFCFTPVVSYWIKLWLKCYWAFVQRFFYLLLFQWLIKYLFWFSILVLQERLCQTLPAFLQNLTMTFCQLYHMKNSELKFLNTPKLKFVLSEQLDSNLF